MRLFVDLGRFECCGCSRRFSMQPGWRSSDVHCACGSLYAKWLNWGMYASEKRSAFK